MRWPSRERQRVLWKKRAPCAFLRLSFTPGREIDPQIRILANVFNGYGVIQDYKSVHACSCWRVLNKNVLGEQYGRVAKVFKNGDYVSKPSALQAGAGAGRAGQVYRSAALPGPEGEARIYAEAVRDGTGQASAFSWRARGEGSIVHPARGPVGRSHFTLLSIAREAGRH
jgi:hypothetical protein